MEADRSRLKLWGRGALPVFLSDPSWVLHRQWVSVGLATQLPPTPFTASGLWRGTGNPGAGGPGSARAR